MTTNNFTITLLIPAYNPTSNLLQLLEDVSNKPTINKIVVVNDGSDESCKILFKKLATIPDLTVLHHTANQGKGQALKTGMQHIYHQMKAQDFAVITADADGQHLAVDILKVAEAIKLNNNELVLGVRNFHASGVPLRSRFGNQLTKFIFRWLYKKEIMDTQTGLRGIPAALITAFLAIPFKGYEYELECLIQAIYQQCSIKQVEISTVYIDNNASSHFRVIRDSFKIYSLFIRHFLSSNTNILK